MLSWFLLLQMKNTMLQSIKMSGANNCFFFCFITIFNVEKHNIDGESLFIFLYYQRKGATVVIEAVCFLLLKAVRNEECRLTWYR
jgi:hypothetical protein